MTVYFSKELPNIDNSFSQALHVGTHERLQLYRDNGLHCTVIKIWYMDYSQVASESCWQ